MLEEDDDENAKIPAAASISNVDDVDAAANALSLVLSKSDFGMMSVLGQFNQGFIITRLGQELFIVDQHAADEKRNFEELQTNAVISSQSLLKPQPLKLSAAEEHLAMEHADTFARNGFGVKIDESAEPGHRVKLVSQPYVDHVMFNMTDLIEIIEQLNSGAPAGSVRCARARKMFASRACRMSTMIGDPLNMQNMRKIVTSLGRLDNPWNCPHGRPTVRHLANIANVTSTQAGRDVQKQAVDEGWQPEPTKARYRCRPLSLKGSLSHC
ncbi:hypothetical protein GQ42DRAFT_125852 [Ramicandelaber brevisporus]|nr:hypothetical protein GQ42DRAFT_125852 [Ramicandelaber brevisporus]